ncbi:unnamed protein product [Phytophthora lilii]|uniref:Unnamed protein product n=1 Tax=Phytophthora lilii TaxID=2077276 RepID=A0A9W6YJJ5_9STRA|nr:unnamed protein product [Phytophthora lilii]
MQLVKGIFIAAMLCVATVSAGTADWEQQKEPKGWQHDADDDTDSNSGSTNTPPPVEQGFNVQQVKFSASDPAKEKGEEKESSSSAVPLIAAVGACACIGVLGAVYLKRRNEEEKLPGEIFTIDDKNSVL